MSGSDTDLPLEMPVSSNLTDSHRAGKARGKPEIIQDAHIIGISNGLRDSSMCRILSGISSAGRGLAAGLQQGQHPRIMMLSI
jgi:hypothetical protein